MRASYNLLKQFVNLENITVQDIADKLTYAGLEIEEISYSASANNLVIGQIIECENHPSSDHLHILKVDLGSKYGIEQIVCGAPNARLGLKVIVARPGAELKSIGVTISKGVIRGVESNGMCCSLVELGVDKNTLSEKQISGIEELPQDAPIGEENVLEYLGLDDAVLDINVLANRSDCLSIFSIAKEVGALFNREVKIPTPAKYDLLESPIVALSNTSNCLQFSLKLVKGVKVKPSPKWLSTYLLNHGIRSINNIVDIGNYIMLLTGQPIHMYDLDKLSSNEFVVRDDYEGSFVALDEKEYELSKGDIVITNNNENGCLGGVMGALSCSVDETSSNIVIESANFLGSNVRRTCVKTGLTSDSSARFIKGINPYQYDFVLDLSAQLLVELADAKEIYNNVSYYVLDTKKTEIECTYSYINKRLGASFTKEEVNDVLNRLGITIKEVDDDKFVCFPPDHRIDLKVNADISEEVFRFIGLDRIQPTLPEMVTTVGGLNEIQNKKRKIREHLISNGLHEVLTYTLVSPVQNSKFVMLNNDEAIAIKNPMTVDHSLVRRGLISSLLECVSYNIAHQNKDVAIFEVSDVITNKNRYEELCVVLSGSKDVKGSLVKKAYDYYDAYGIFSSIMQLFGIDNKRYRFIRLEDSEYFHPGKSAQIFLGKERVGIIGEVHPNHKKGLGNCIVLNLNLSAFYNLKCSATKMQKISKFPSVERDYALVLRKEILADEFIKTIKKESRGLIEDVNIFDIYEGEFLPDGYKSIAVKIKYYSLDHTLKDEDINPIVSNVLNALNKNFGAYLRS